MLQTAKFVYKFVTSTDWQIARNVCLLWYHALDTISLNKLLTANSFVVQFPNRFLLLWFKAQFWHPCLAAREVLGVSCQLRRQGLRHPVDCVVTGNQVPTSLPPPRPNPYPSRPYSVPPHIVFRTAISTSSRTTCNWRLFKFQMCFYMYSLMQEVIEFLCELPPLSVWSKTKYNLFILRRFLMCSANIHNSVSLSLEETAVRSEGEGRIVVWNGKVSKEDGVSIWR